MFVVNLCFWKKWYFYQYQNIEPNCVFETEEEAKAYEMRNPNTGWISKVNIHLVIYINQIEELRLGQLCLQDYDTNFSKDWNTKINQLENIDKVPRFSSLWRLSSKESNGRYTYDVELYDQLNDEMYSKVNFLYDLVSEDLK